MPRMSSTVKALDNTFDSWKESFNFSNFMKERKITVNAWITFGFVIIALMLSLVTAAAPGWAWTREIRGNGDKLFEGECYGQYGLWYACWTLIEDPSRHHCRIINHLEGIPGWWFGVQAMGTISLIGCVASFSALTAYIFVKSFNRAPFIINSVCVSTLTSAVLSLPFFTVFCVLYIYQMWWCCPGMTIEVPQYHLHYCFILACITWPVNIVSFVFAFREMKALRNPAPDKHYDESQADHTMSHIGPAHNFRDQLINQRLSYQERHYQDQQYQDYPMKQYPPHEGYPPQGYPPQEGYPQQYGYDDRAPTGPGYYGEKGGRYDDRAPPGVRGDYDEPYQGGNPYGNAPHHYDAGPPRPQYEDTPPPPGSRYDQRAPPRGNGRELYPSDDQPQVLRMGTQDSSVA